MDTRIWRGTSFSIDGYAAYRKVDPGYSDDEADVKADRETRTIGGKLDAGFAKLDVRHQLTFDNTENDANVITRKWNDWRGLLTFDTDSSNVILPRKSAIEVKRKHLTAYDFGSQFSNGPDKLTRQVKLKLKWLGGHTKARFELSNSVLDDRMGSGKWDRKLTRKLLLGYSTGSKKWKFSGKASAAETVRRKGDDRDRESEFGLETSFEVSPQIGDLLSIEAELAGANRPNGQGFALEEALITLSYKFRF